MSPREALQKKPVASPSVARPDVVAPSLAEVHVSTILDQLISLPSDLAASVNKTSIRRNPADALRWFAVLDALAMAGGYVAAWAVASVHSALFLGHPFASVSVWDEGFRFLQFGAVALGVLLWFWNTGHYSLRRPFWFEVQTVFNAFGMALIVDGFFQFAAKQDFSRMWLGVSWLFGGLAVVALRHAARRSLRRDGVWQLRTLLVGSGTMADETREALRSEPGLGYEIVSQIENLPLVLAREGFSWDRLCNKFKADYVVIALDGRELAESDEAIAQLVREDIPFSVSPPLRHLPVLGMTPHYFFNHDVMLMTHGQSLDNPLPRFLKRAMDIVGSGLGLLFLSPLLGYLAFQVRRDGGPIFFYDRRVGLDGRPFDCLKFRSMVVDAQRALDAYLDEHPLKKAEWSKYHKLREGDPRVTKIGDVMRTWSLDELPQLINVLRGDMSLVGPRPINAAEQAGYAKDITQYHRVRPGLTGLWQVSGRSNVDFARRVQMDSWYVRNWSLWHDIAILFKTIPAVLKKTGAY